MSVTVILSIQDDRLYLANRNENYADFLSYLYTALIVDLWACASPGHCSCLTATLIVHDSIKYIGICTRNNNLTLAYDFLHDLQSLFVHCTSICVIFM